MQKKAIFIDKDGTLIPDIPYNVNPDLIRLQQGAEKLQLLQELGYLVIVVTNQSGVALGYFEEKALAKVEVRLRHLLKEKNVQLDGFYYCPHHPKGKVIEYAKTCTCRKPESGMIEKAALDFDIDLSSSWMMGDILNDVEAGKKVGCNTILIDNGNETEWLTTEWRTPTFTAKDLDEACEFILSKELKYQ